MSALKQLINIISLLKLSINNHQKILDKDQEKEKEEEEEEEERSFIYYLMLIIKSFNNL